MQSRTERSSESRSAPLPGPRPARGGGRKPIMVALVTGLVALVAVLQLRSQVEVQRSLDTQDNTSLAFLIDDLHRANDSLQIQISPLAGQRDQPGTGHRAAQPELPAQRQRRRVLDGLHPAHGPGTLITADAPLPAADLAG